MKKNLISRRGSPFVGEVGFLDFVEPASLRSTLFCGVSGIRGLVMSQGTASHEPEFNDKSPKELNPLQDFIKKRSSYNST